MELRGAAALVTGGASGLGLATVRELAGAGAAVVIADLQNSPGATVTDTVMAEVSGQVVFTPTDVTNDQDVQAAVEQAARFGPLRVLVNCAGVATAGRLLGRQGPLPMEQFRRVIEVNLSGAFNAMRLAAARMADTEPMDGERGVIVNTASVAAFDGQVGQPAYAASKGGLVAMTLPLARELADTLIRVVTIAPGMFETPMFSGLAEEARRSLTRQVPHPRRLGHPAEFAGLVRHIIDNPMLNGEVIRLDGAVRMQPR